MSLEKAIKNKGGQIYVGTGTGKSSTTGQSSGGGGRVTAAGVDAVSSAAKAFTPKEKNKIQRDILTDDIEELKKKRNALVGSGANIGAGTTGLGISRSSNSNRSQITAIDRIIARKTEQANQLKAEAQRAKREARNAKIVNFARDPLSAVDRAISGVDKVTGKINSGIADVFRGEESFKARAEANKAMPTASKPSLGRAIEGTIVKGADQAVGFAAQTLDVTLGNALAELGWEDNIIRKAVARQKANAEANEIYYGKNMANASKAAKKIEQYTTSAMASVPDAIIAMMLAAASPATAGAGALGLTGAGERLLGKEAIVAGREAAALATKTSKLATGANTVRTVVGNMARNPLYWTSFAKVVGPSYYQAKEDDASDWAANMYALTNGLFNAAIEVGGGIQTLPFEMRKGPQTFWQFIKNSAGDEGDEEVVQGVIERGLQNLIYGKDNPLWSTTDENAVFNPKTALDEGAGGAWGGLLMGGGQNVTSQLQSSMSNRAIGEAMAPSQKIETLNTALNMPDSARSRGLADKIVEQMQKGDTISDAKFGELYRASREDASRNIQPKSEDDSGYEIRRTEDGGYELTSRMGRMAEQIAAKGESAPNAIKAARTISDLLNGSKLSKSQIKNQIVKSEAARAVFAETTGAELPDMKTVSVSKMADIIQAEADLYYAKKQADEALAQEGEAIAQARETFDAAVAENAQAAQAEAQEIMGNAVAQAEAEMPQATTLQDAPEQEQPAAQEPQQPQPKPRETYEEFVAREQAEAQQMMGWQWDEKDLADIWRKATENDGVKLSNGETIPRDEFIDVFGKYLEFKKGKSPGPEKLEVTYQNYRVNSDSVPMSADLWERMKAAAADTETEAQAQQEQAPVATGAQAQESVNDDYWESLLNETPPPPKDRRYAITVEEADVAKEQGIDADTDVSREQLLMAMYLQPYLKNVGIENIRFVNDQETKGGRGVWDRDSKTVLINKDRADSAHLVAQTIGHEIFHPAVEQTREESGKLEESLSEDFLGALKDLSNRGLLNGRTGAAINYAVENMDEIVKAYRDRYAAQYRAMGYRPTMVKALTHDSMIREEIACDLLGDVLDSQNVLNKIAGVRPDLLTQVSHAIQRMKQTNAGMVYATNTADFRAATDKIDDIAKKINGALTRATRASGRGGEGGQRFALPVKFGSGADTYWLNPEAVDQALAKAQADGNQLDADYFQALKDNNKARVREILEQAAIQNGYDPMIQYRGSQDTFTPSSPYFTWTDHRNTFLSPQLKESAVYGRRKEHPSYRTIQSANLMGKLDEIVEQEDDERLVELMNAVMGEGHRYLSDEQKSTMQKSVATSLRPVADRLRNSYEAAASALDEDTSGYAEDVLNFLEGVQSLEENDGDWSLDEVREAAEYADDGFAELTDYYQDSRGEIPSEAMPFFDALHNIQNWTQLERGIEFFVTFADPDTHIFSSDLEQAIPREEAVRDLKEKANSGIYQMYLRLGDNPLEFDAKGDMWNELTYDHLDPYSRPYAGTTDDFATWADTNGYSSLIIKNVIDGPIGALDDYIVFDSNNMKSADLVTFDDRNNIIPPSERFNPSKENWRFALDVPFAGLYNLSERVIADTKQNKLGAGSVISMLRGKGVKAEEIKWLGLEDFLRGKKSVTKDELLQYIRDNDLVIEEQTLDGSVRPGKYDFTNAEFVDAETGEVIGRTKAEAEQYLIDKYGEEYVHWNVEYSDDPDIGFFASYPSEEDPAFDEAISLAVPARESDGLSTQGNAPHWYQFKLRGGHDYRELLFKLPGSDFQTIGSTTHWKEDAPGVLAHARVQDFITPTGDDVLFVDEIQSDWHNLGNTIGYDTPDNAGVKRMHEVAQQLTQLDDNWDRDAQEWGPMPDDFEGEVTDFNDEYIKQRDELYDEFLALWDKAFPDTKSTREALNEELDSMTPILEKLWPHSPDYLTQFREKLRPHGYITPNKYQAGTLEGSISEYLGPILQRHNDQLEQIMETEPTNPYKRYLSPEEMNTFLDWVKRRDKFVYKTSMRNAYIAHNGPAPEAPFAKNYTDFVLKNLLREAVINEYDGLAWTSAKMQSDRWGDDFAEGYRVEYDQDIPKFLDKFGKKFGARVGTTRLLSDYGETIEVPYLPITDEMRESILENGLPKFALDVDLPGQIRDVIDRRMPKEQYVYYGDTTQRMQDVGFPADKVPVLQSQRKARLAMQDKDIDNDSAHGITDWQLAQIPKYLEDPVMIVDVPSDVLGHKPSVLFVTDMLDGDGFPIVAAVNAKESAARKRWSEMDVRPLPEFIHEIATVYGRGPLSSSMPRAVTEGPSDNAETGKTFEQFIQKAMDTDNILYISEEGVKNLLRASNEWQNKKNQPRLTATGNLTPRAVGRERSMPGETALQAEGSADSRNRVSPASAFVKRNEPKPLRDTAERAVYNNWVAFPEGFADIPRDVVLHQSRNIPGNGATGAQAQAANPASAFTQRLALDVEGVDMARPTGYDNVNGQIPGGEQNGYASNPAAAFQRRGNDGTNPNGAPGLLAQSRADQGRPGQTGRVPLGARQLRLSPETEAKLRDSKVYAEVYDTTNDPAVFSSALDAARESDVEHGWAVTPKTEEEIRQSGARLFTTAGHTAGLAVTPDGDIEGLFSNKPAGAPKGVARNLIPLAIGAGGRKLDCYGTGLMDYYSAFGFIPVAKTKFNPEYANPGWTLDKGQPDIYFMMYTGPADADAAANAFDSFPAITQEYLDSLPYMEYDDSYAHRDDLLGNALSGQRFAFDVDIPEFDEYMRQMAAMTQQRNAQRQRPTIPTKAEFDRASDPAPVATSATGTGAASRGFVRNRTYDTAERYAEALEKYGAMPPRPSRENGDMPVPQQMNDDTRVSEVAQNAMTSRFVTPQMLKTLNKAVADGKMSYFPITDQASAARAKATMIDKGWERTLADWTAEVQSGRVTKDNVTQGLLMYNAALDAGDPQRAIQILVDLSENVRSGAQAVQAMSMLDKLTPEGKLVGLQRSVQNLEREIRDRLGDRAPDSLTIDPNLLQEYLDATDDAQREKAMDRIYQNIADQIPATWADKFNNWRYMAMLANPRTHIRNIMGNFFFAPVRGAKNVVATGLESVFIPKDSGQRTKALVAPSFLKNAADKARYQAAIDEWPEVEAMVQSGGKFRGGGSNNIWSEIRDRQTVYDKVKPAEWVRKKNSELLDREDTWFSKPAYASSLTQYLKANGITAEQYNSPGFDKTDARKYAIEEAQKATYRDFNAFSDMVSSLGFKNPKTNVQKGVNTFVEAVLPFKRTPANILVRGVEYSPIGLARGLKQAAVDVRNGDKTAAEALDQIASGLTGTGLLALGFLLAKHGVLTGGAPDKDKENAMNKLTGHQNYALELGGKSYTLDWLAPEALPVFVGVELFKEKADGLKSGDDLFKPITRITEPVLEMSMLQSLNDIIDSVGYKNDGKLWTMLASAATSYLTQYVPTLGGQIERAFFEKTQQRSYTDKNSKIPTDIQYALAKAMNKTPGEYAQVEYVDEWGRKHDTGSFIARLFTNFFSPGYYSKVNETEVDKMLKDLYEATGDTAVYPAAAEKDITVDKETHRLTKDQYTSFSEALGTTRYDMLESLRNDPAFKSLSDADKANVVKGVYEYAKGVAEQKIYPEKDVDTWIKDAGKAKSNFGLNPTEYLMLYKQYGSSMLSGEDKQAKAIEAYKAGVPLDKYLATKSSMKNYDTDGNDSYTNAETIRGITSANLDEKQQQAMLGMQLSDSAMTKYNGARAAGISADTYAMILEETTNEKMPANGVRGAHKAKVNAYLQDLVNQQVITPAQKAYLETLSLG